MKIFIDVVYYFSVNKAKTYEMCHDNTPPKIELKRKKIFLKTIFLEQALRVTKTESILI